MLSIVVLDMAVNKMNTLSQILDIIGKRKYIKLAIENNSTVWSGQWLVSLNMMDGKGSVIFHSYDFEIALKEALKFLYEKQ